MATCAAIAFHTGILAEQSGAAESRQRRQPQVQRPARDVTRPEPQPGTAAVAGRVLAADTGAPVRRARIVAAGQGWVRSATTDELGRYRITDLPAGSYTVSAAKPGFIESAYGQRRPLAAGTPIQLADGQHAANVDLRLARGGVITGHVLDETGEPMARAIVSALRYRYVRGERQLTVAGTDQSDDRGQFRVFGLAPGDYYVSAAPGGVERSVERAAAAGGRGRGGLVAPDVEEQAAGYAPTYYPGVVSATDAARLKLAPSQELASVDFQLQIVPLATVRGALVAGTGTIVLLPESTGRGLRAQTLRASIGQDGTFAITRVPPGRYVAVARLDGSAGRPVAAVQPVVVTGDDVTITLVPVAGARLQGTIALEPARTAAPSTLQGFRVSLQPLDAAVPLPRTNRPAPAGVDGAFLLSDLMPGRYVVQASAPRGWTMKSVYLDGRDVTDQPIELKGGESGALKVMFTEKISSVSGAVRAESAGGLAGLTVIAFPADADLWRPLSRRIQTGRTNEAGEFRIGNLPPGEYLFGVADAVEQGEWFDPDYLESLRARATRVSVEEGEQKRVDLDYR